MNIFVIFQRWLSYIGAALKSGFFRAVSLIPGPSLPPGKWLYLPRILTKKEKKIFSLLLLIAMTSGAALAGKGYMKITVLRPAFGGTHREGVLQEPRFINPIYAASNDTDRDIASLIFAGLIRYTPEGKPEPHLAESIEISEDGKTYAIRLRSNLRWHDGKPLTADDVLFTIKTIQNPDFKSPLRQNWQGVSVEKVDEQNIRFSLRQPYAPFVENLTVGIIPEHLWAKISPNSAPLSDLNLKPIGAGPYQFESFTRRADGSVTSYTVRASRAFYRGRPHIKEITFLFYPSETELLAAYHKGEIDGISMLSTQNVASAKKAGISLYQLRLPRIVAVFFNAAQQNAFADKSVRQALAYAIDVNAMIRDVLAGGAEIAPSPIPPNTAKKDAAINPPPFDTKKAKELLDQAGWKDENNDGMREKKETKNRKTVLTPLKIEISTSDFPELVLVANFIKNAWDGIGVTTEIKTLNPSDLESTVIRPRAYQVLLFGEIFGHDPDPFAFWHTSQIKDPGLNVALYSDRKADVLLEEARRTGDTELREKKYREFESIVVGDQAAIFLYRPRSYYGARPDVKGIRVENIILPHERFAFIEEWYIKTRRWFK